MSAISQLQGLYAPGIQEDFNNNYNNDYYQNYGYEEDDLIPDLHPEQVTSLAELEAQLKDINKLLENRSLSYENRKKLEKLKNLYLQQKNILIENETKKAKEEMINQNRINVEKMMREEEERRKKELEEEQRKLEEEMQKKKQQEKQYQKKYCKQEQESCLFQRIYQYVCE